MTSSTTTCGHSFPASTELGMNPVALVWAGAGSAPSSWKGTETERQSDREVWKRAREREREEVREGAEREGVSGRGIASQGIKA